MDNPEAPQPLPSKKSPVRYILLTISLVVIALVLVYFGALSPKKSSVTPTPPQTAGPKPSPFQHTVLSFVPGSVSLSDATEGSAEVMVDPGMNPVTAVQLEISYDPKVLTNVTVQSEKTFFTGPIVLINNSNKEAGHITYALGITPAQQPVTTPGKVVKITFTKKAGAKGQTMIKLTPDTLVAASGIGPSVLKSASDLTVTF